ncbi:restriction endonuclease subunit S [Vibrio rotiferianus]|uniref:restriction endonuclease subunit S n=1 Tax=Vibrio rotiferianus TaxID=190895 RepID=UPI0011102B9E|nr:restriction endonuclease subunit S [Vibrio rotiferianus]TMX41259.1 restriction endonuclease subunit S [Vibrio rotiferianus]TMX58214.1 restriction endonuclease subunit S [Vibrio rotiferianus]TMX60982.1 restriction endonuclease subunit S [Vibrio rotiferianus]
MSSLPRLRLPEFSDSDTYCPHKFDDIFLFSSGKNIKQNESSPEFSTPCVRYGELYHMYGEVITRTINNTNLEHSELTFSAGNEILLPSAGEDPLDIGSASALTLEGVAIGRTINVLRPKGTIDYSHIYVSYYINEKLRKRISQLARGASISNVYNSDLKTLKACLPTFPEQQKVASFLSKVDEKISLLTEKKDKLTEYKKGVMQQLFNGKWQEQDGLLTFIPPTLRFKANDGSDFPDWEEIELGKLSKKSTDKNKDTSVSAVLTNSATQGIIPQADYFDRDIANQSNLDGYYVVKPNDFVYNPRISTPAPVGPINRNKLDVGVMSPLYTVFTVNKSVSLSYLEYFFKTTNWHRYMNSIANFGARHDRMNITTSDFFKMPIPVPCIEEQNKIVQFVSSIEQKLDLANSELEKAKEWKKGLLQQMFV